MIYQNYQATCGNTGDSLLILPTKNSDIDQYFMKLFENVAGVQFF